MRILFLDDEDVRHRTFNRIIRGRAEIVNVKTSVELAAVLEDVNGEESRAIHFIFLDHDLHEESSAPYGGKIDGSDVAKWLAQELTPDAALRILIHSANQDGAQRMFTTLSEAGFQVVVAEFGTDEFTRFLDEHLGPRPAMMSV